ncbi:MAG: DUF4878 domain-containing protein [Prevotella sp.]|jgi:hypothetical protein|nr:DUF4878 domain-containing protein [Prevotella sp.]
MKKNVCYLLSLVAMCLFLFSSCSSSGPGEEAKKYINYLAKGDFEKFADGIAYEDTASKEEIQAAKAMMAGMGEKAKKTIEASGGVKGVEVVSEDISEDGNSAEVVLKVTYGDGSTKDSDVDMVKKDGKWKMEMKK